MQRWFLILMMLFCMNSCQTSYKDKQIKTDDIELGSSKMYYTLDREFFKYQVDSMINADKLDKIEHWIQIPLKGSDNAVYQYMFIKSLDKGDELIYTVTRFNNDTIFKCTKRVTDSK